LRVRRTIGALGVVLALGAGAAASAQPYEVVHELRPAPADPAVLRVEAPDGRIYGTTDDAISVLVPDGSGGYSYSLLHTLTAAEGVSPSGLVLGTDGLFYGTAHAGGANGMGTVFRADEAGAITSLHDFAGADGNGPMGLVEGPDGAFYGTTSGGGDEDVGTVFRIDTTGTLTTVHSFSALTGGSPQNPVILASDGDFYGTTSFPPTVFRITDEGDLTTLVTMAADQRPLGIIEGSDGLFYGTSAGAVFNGTGTAFHVDPQGNFGFLYIFSFQVRPTSKLVEAADGKLYGAQGSNDLPPLGYGSIYRLSKDGTYEGVHGFTGVDGAYPGGPLFEASDGKIYGTTFNGGAAGHGNVFRVATDGQFELVHQFGLTEATALVDPLLAASDGNLYGIAGGGGQHFQGSMFRLELPDGFSLLYSFDRSAGDACAPESPLVEGDSGYLYGVSTCGVLPARGNFVRFDPAGNEEILQEFENYGDGPVALMRASDGNFYGVTQDWRIARLDPSGGLSYPFPVQFPGTFIPDPYLVEGPDGRLYGTMHDISGPARPTLFRIEASGDLAEVVEFPASIFLPGPLTLGSDGWFYGTSTFGGSGAGAVFRVSPAGAFELLYAFRPVASGDAAYPYGGLTEGPDGTFYGAASGGPADPQISSGGVIFRIDTLGNESIVHSFRGAAEGEGPGQPALAADGHLYGSAWRFDETPAWKFFFRIDPAATITGLTVEPGSGPASGGTPVTIGGPVQPDASIHFGIFPALGSPAAVSGGVAIAAPHVDPGVLYHVIVRNPDGAEGSVAGAWFADFLDVAQGDIFHPSVEKIFRAGITAGCGEGNYCRNAPVTRAQMAVFLLKAKYGYLYAPPPATGLVFADVPIEAFAAAWIEQLAALEIAAGCGGGNYCPDQSVTRAQMAVFLLKTLLGSDYDPPDATGAIFEDVPADGFAADFIEDLAARGITGGCSLTPPLYCPDNPNTRGQMAVFLATTFGLP
jgi:uncharacterized repeat protein (TIGR03803 family)